MSREVLAEKHSWFNDTIFKIKMNALIMKRFFENRISPKKKFKDYKKLVDAPVIAFSESDLWNPFDNKDNWILTAGKIENLRIAAKKLNGLEVEAGKVFSFWRHIGNPNFGQDYVVGREIREGCIVPTVAGGLCQLSNALYDAALKANFDIIERHKHTKVVKGSLAEKDRDATVKWNYIDLCFKASINFRIDVELTADKLVVSFRSNEKNGLPTDATPQQRNSNLLNDCYSCGNFACFKHPNKSSKKEIMATTTFILDEKWVEYDEYIQSVATPNDNFILPLSKNRWIKSERYNWKAANPKNTFFTTFEGIYRAIKLRLANRTKKNNVFELMLALDKKIAHKATKNISIDTTHLVISQNLLPFIYETGVLGGRTFDVLMTRLPFEKLHQNLDVAFSKYPNSPTLRDFRASNELIQLENAALTKARKIITPHAGIAELFKNKVEKLNWKLPNLSPIKKTGSKVLFPTSAVGRKGAYEIKRLLQELNFELVVAGNAIEEEGFWEDLKIEKFAGNYEEISLVIYPTYIENQPRQILKAIAMKIPVITTEACGLEESELIDIISLNQMDSIKNKIQDRLYVMEKI